MRRGYGQCLDQVNITKRARSANVAIAATSAGGRLLTSPSARLSTLIGAFQLNCGFQPALGQICEHGLQGRVCSPFGQFSTPQRALTASLWIGVHAYEPTLASPNREDRKTRQGALRGVPRRGSSPHISHL